MPSMSIDGMNISRRPPMQKSPGRSTERRLLSSAAPIDGMTTPHSLKKGTMIRSSRRYAGPSRDYAQRAHAREIAAMSHQCGGVDRQRARRLNGVCQLQPERSPQSRCTFRDVDVERDRLPRFEDRPVTPRERVIGRLEWTGSTSATVMIVTAKRRRPAAWASKSGLKRGPNFGCPSRT